MAASRRSKNTTVNQYQLSDILPEYGLRNFLGSREGSKVGVGGWRGAEGDDGGAIQYAPGAPT